MSSSRCHGSDADNTADATHEKSNEDQGGNAVPVNERTRFPKIGIITSLNAVVVESVNSRANHSRLPPSPDHASDEPCESSAAPWARDASAQLFEAVCFSESIEELEHCHDACSNIEDEAP